MKRSWYLGVIESMGHVPKMSQFDNWNLLKTVSLEILAMQQSSNYNEVPIPGVCLHFCHTIINAFQISFVLLLQKACHPMHPLIRPLHLRCTLLSKQLFISQSTSRYVRASYYFLFTDVILDLMKISKSTK